MVPNTVTSLVLIVLAVLPGLTYVLSFERQAGRYGVTLADRVLRLIFVSAVFHVVVGWFEYWVYRSVLAGYQEISAGQFAVLWLGVIFIVIVPAAAGTLIGSLYRTRRTRDSLLWIRRWLSQEREEKILDFLLGQEPAPRAWDDYFSSHPASYLRIGTKDGTLLAGRFANRSYAAGFPQDPDLLLEEAWQLSENGEFLRPLGYALYVGAREISWMEIVPPQGEEPT